MSQRVMQVENLYNFSLVRFEPDSIILLDKNTRKPYEFYHSVPNHHIHPELSHPSLLRPILYKSGALYARGCETLATMLDFRRRDYRPLHFTVQQIANTFEPVLECLDYLHESGVSFGKLTPHHVSFFASGEVLLKDWLLGRGEPAGKGGRARDLREVGLMLAETATLSPMAEIGRLPTVEIVAMMLEGYPVSFCTGVAVLLEGLHKHYGSVMELLRGHLHDCKISETKTLLDEATELRALRLRQKTKPKEQEEVKDKLLKEVENEKCMATPRRDKDEQHKYQSVLNQNCSTHGSPIKKFNITTPSKKVIRLEDCQNKKVFNQEVKKRQIEKITKIIQRSNAFVNQLMSRKNNDKKFFNTSKVTTSIFDTQQNAKRIQLVKESPKISSPSKRMRSISKKK